MGLPLYPLATEDMATMLSPHVRQGRNASTSWKTRSQSPFVMEDMAAIPPPPMKDMATIPPHRVRDCRNAPDAMEDMAAILPSPHPRHGRYGHNTPSPRKGLPQCPRRHGRHGRNPPSPWKTAAMPSPHGRHGHNYSHPLPLALENMAAMHLAMQDTAEIPLPTPLKTGRNTPSPWNTWTQLFPSSPSPWKT